MPKPKLIPKRCDQCELLRINGVVCHEIGCPNMGARWENGEWIHYVECWDCGCDVKRGESCDCMEVYEDA